ncbi:MAG: PorP/SprF family type IX secretion system membrane protein [Saprospiraceae bacterium]|nr:PorP/SprF family type IX secretion system membrane protein [Saprospiraceae bacterium]
MIVDDSRQLASLFCILILLLFGRLQIYAQDPVFSQFYTAPLHLNPALTGITEGSKIALNYRNQWPSINQAYVTYAASYDQFFPYINSGFGLTILADDAGRGLYKTTVVQGSYSYNVKFRNNLQMRLGLAAAWISSRIDWAKLVFSDQLDPEFGATSPGGLPYPTEEIGPEGGNSVSVLDAIAGLVMFNEHFYAGFALKHLNFPQFSFLQVNDQLSASGLPLSLSLHAGTEIDLVKLRGKSDVFMSPGLQYIRQGRLSQLNIGTIFRYYLVGAGLWYRHSSTNPDSVIFSVEGRKDKYRLSYSYDVTLSKLRNSGGAHEISFIINFVSEPKESRYNDCFNLFR